MQITGGTVTFGRTVQPAQYESKKAEVQLTFIAPEGGQVTDEQVSEVFQMAQNKCLEILGIKPAPAATKTSVPATPKPTEASKGGAGTETAQVVSTKTKADLEAEQAAKLNGKNKADPRVTPAKKPPKTAASADEIDVMGETQGISTGEERVDPTQVEGIDDDVLGPLGGEDEVVETITDEALTSAITKHNAKINNPVAIRGLIGKYFDKPQGKQARDIPQEKRAEFLKALVAL